MVAPENGKGRSENVTNLSNNPWCLMENGSFQDHFFHNQTGNRYHIPGLSWLSGFLHFFESPRAGFEESTRVILTLMRILRPSGTTCHYRLDGHEFLLEVYAQHLNHRQQVICLCSIDCFNAWMCRNPLHGSTER